MNKELKILIATKNPGKIKAVSLGLDKYYDNYTIDGVSVLSDVSDQPVNEDIYKGAVNRCHNLRKYALDNNIEADFYIAVEGGITNLLGSWVNLNIVYIEDKEGNKSTGISQGYPFPEKYLDEILESEFGKVMDKYLSLSNSGQENGPEYIFSKGNLSRIDLIKDATIFALTKFVNKDIWE